MSAKLSVLGRTSWAIEGQKIWDRKAEIDVLLCRVVGCFFARKDCACLTPECDVMYMNMSTEGCVVKDKGCL